MFSLEPDDFMPLDQSEYMWRWTDPAYTTLPKELVSHIHALKPARAKSLEHHLLPACQTVSTYLFQEIPEYPDRMTPFSVLEKLEIGMLSDESVRAWLKEQPVPQETLLLLSWDKANAVVVPWNIFYDYWDDFCYPGGDDICMSSVDGTWRLVYYHENLFLLGRLKEPNESPSSEDS